MHQPPSRILILETSGRAGAVALARGDSLLAARRLDETRRHARDLAPAVAELLRQQNWTARNLDAVFVSRGPGSYTGLRVGLMSAKMLAYATGCLLLGIDTFAAIAQQAPSTAGRLEVLADAQQGKIYVQTFERAAGGGWQALTPIRIERFDDWLAGREPASGVSGPGLMVHGKKLPANALVVSASDWDPRAASLLKLGLIRLRAGERDDPWTLEPLYLRPSAAEEQRRGHTKK
jgi:tRNA threonylcarbamoyladenosine biosynthesis protein TsaB